MAEKQVGGLSLRIGLTLSQLQSDFLAAEQTVKQGIAALNRQQNIVKLKMETDVTGLDAVADKTKILEVQERGLTQLLEMQRDRLTLATKAYQEYANTKGANETVAKKLETSMERERLAVARLEAQLKSLSAQKVSIDTSQLQDNIARLNARIQNIKISAEIDTSKLQDAGRIFDVQKTHVAALTQELELQRQKLAQLREAMYRAAQAGGADSVHTLQVKTNVLQQIQQINQLEAKLKELSTTDIRLQIRAESLKNVETNINQNIAQLNARIENVRVKTDIDVSKISSAASEFDKAKAQVQGLNRELTLQNQKLAEMRNALANSISANGFNNVKTITLQTEIQKQIQAIDQLKAKISELNKIPPPKENKLLSGYLNIKGDAIAKLNSFTTAFSNLQGATSAADSAITAVLGVIGEMPRSVGLATAALVGLPLIFKGIENSIVDMMKATAAAGDATYVMSRGFQMSVKDTGKFVTMAKTAGADVNDLASTIKRVQQAIVRGGEDAKAEQWLRRYGESAFDASGHLKNLNDMTLTLSRALKRAQADGNGMAFILGTMRSASADVITTIEDAEDVYKQAATIVKAGLANPALSHETQGNLNALNQQAAQLGTNFKSALLPVANEIIPRLTERMGKMTQLIADNKDVIIEFGRAGAEAFLKMEEAAETVGGTFARIGKFFVDLKKNPREAEFIAKYKDDFDIKSVDDLIRKEQPASFDVIKGNTILYNQVRAMYQPLFKAIDDVHKEIENKNKELKESLQQPLTSVADISSAASSRLKLEENPELLKQAESVKKILQEASDIQYKLSHSDYQNKQLDLLQWRQDLLNQADKTAEEREAVERLYSVKLAQIEQERADKLKQIRKSVDAEFKTEIENRIAKIEEEKDAWIKAGMDEAEATELAQKRIAKARQDAEQELTTAIQSLHQTALEQRLSQIDKEREAWINKCNDEVRATQWAEQAKMDAQRDAAMRIIKQQAEEYEAFQKGGYEGLQAYKYAQLAEQGVNLSYLNMTPEQLQQFQRANQTAERSLMPNFMTADDKATHQQLIDESKAFRRELAGMQDKKNYVIVDGKKIGMNEALYGKDSIAPTKFTVNNAEFEIRDSGASQTVSDYDKDGRPTKQIYRSFDYNEQGHIAGGQETKADYQFSEGKITLDMNERDYFPPPDDNLFQSFSDLPQAVMGVSETLSEMPPAVQSAIESLNEFPVTVQGISESLTDLAQPRFEAIENPFTNLEPQIASVIERFSNMNIGVQEVTVKLNDLQTAIANLNWKREDLERTTRTPVNVQVTVEIKEAHAWDSEHIQELSDRVADEIQPAIVGAIGGDSNSY